MEKFTIEITKAQAELLMDALDAYIQQEELVIQIDKLLAAGSIAINPAITFEEKIALIMEQENKVDELYKPYYQILKKRLTTANYLKKILHF